MISKKEKLTIEFQGNGIIKTNSKLYNFDCFIIPRECISNNIPGLETQRMVYCLVDNDESKKEKRKIYIGKTGTGMPRFFDHVNKKDFWNRLIIFTSDDDTFDQDIILGLEHYLINKYKNSYKSYELVNASSSSQRITPECERFGEQIINILDFYGYPIETLNDDMKVQLQKPTTVTSTQAVQVVSDLFTKMDNAIKDISRSNISSEPTVRYMLYRYKGKNICAVWQYGYGLEIELWTTVEEITIPYNGAYSIINRKRGNRKSAIKVENDNHVNIATEIIKELVAKY